MPSFAEVLFGFSVVYFLKIEGSTIFLFPLLHFLLDFEKEESFNPIDFFRVTCNLTWPALASLAAVALGS